MRPDRVTWASKWKSQGRRRRSVLRNLLQCRNTMGRQSLEPHPTIMRSLLTWEVDSCKVRPLSPWPIAKQPKSCTQIFALTTGSATSISKKAMKVVRPIPNLAKMRNRQKSRLSLWNIVSKSSASSPNHLTPLATQDRSHSSKWFKISWTSPSKSKWSLTNLRSRAPSAHRDSTLNHQASKNKPRRTFPRKQPLKQK